MTIARVLCACLAFLGAAAFGFWGIPSLSASHGPPSSPAQAIPNGTTRNTTMPSVSTGTQPEEPPAKPAPPSSAPQRAQAGQTILPKAVPPSLRAARVPANTIAPQLLSHPEPTLTDAARQANVTGAVVKLALNVTTVGFSQNIRVIKGESYGLNRKAIDAVSHWHFQPATRNGEPVTAEIEVDVHFQP